MTHFFMLLWTILPLAHFTLKLCPTVAKRFPTPTPPPPPPSNSVPRRRFLYSVDNLSLLNRGAYL
ncbi:hypothetical protein AKJ16_DCAP17033 [Drosera capensis]